MQTVNFFGGRFNPLSKKHHEIIEDMTTYNGDHIVFIIDGEKSSLDMNKNPLDSEIRKEVIKSCFPNIKIDVCSSIFQSLEILDVMGYDNIRWFCGSDREESYKKISVNFDANIEIISFERDVNISATMIRKGIIENKDVSNLLPPLKNDIKNKIKGIIKNVSTNNTGRSR